jgi:hypothetical protein
MFVSCFNFFFAVVLSEQINKFVKHAKATKIHASFLKVVFCRGIGNRSFDAVVCVGGFGRRDCGAFASGPN